MNALLKAMLKEVMDLVSVGKLAVAKNYMAMLGAVLGAGEDVPAIVSNWADMKPELQALIANPAADADLLAYAVTLVGGESVAVQAVVSASAKLILDGVANVEALLAAIAAAKAAPAPVPAA